MIDLISIAKEWSRDPALMGALEPVVAVAVVALFVCVGFVAFSAGVIIVEKRLTTGFAMLFAWSGAFLALGLFVFTFAYAHHYAKDHNRCPTFETQRYIIERGE
jgi:hypothetical protein